MTPEQFIEIIKGQSVNTPAFKIASIPADYLTGLPTLKFDGETEAGTRAYPYVASYTPAPNDRVLVALVGHGGVILGKIIST